ncbi:MAG: hypothetical protein KAT66_05020 [Candidatus Lokiarchaeota archaeon]|nr:hypothetical protein [Candidatus Lokiarchaeota archaeon]
MTRKKKEELNYVYGGLEEFDDFQEIRERELYEVKNILNNYIKQQNVINSTETHENLKVITDFLKNDLNMLQNLNSAIVTLTKQVENIKKKMQKIFLLP